MRPITPDPRQRPRRHPQPRQPRPASRAVRQHARVDPRERRRPERAPRAHRRPPARPAVHTRGRRPRRSGTVRLTFRAGNPRRRLIAVFVVSAALFGLVIARVVLLQTSGSQHLIAAGRAQSVSESVLHATRGTIFARDGAELVLSVPSTTIFANPKLVTDPTGTASILASMLNLSADKQASLLASFTAKDKSFVYVARQVDDELGAAVMALRLSGVDSLSEDKRVLPSGDVARSIIGRTDIDGKGTAGLELQYDAMLTGTDGERVREHDRNGRSIPGAGATTIAPVPGVDLVLTLDRSLQYQVEQALLARTEMLKAKGGSVVVMDTRTGDIYASANVERNTTTGAMEVTSANKSAVEAFEPGSVAKVFSISGVVDSGAANADTTIAVPGIKVFNSGTKWEQTIRDAEPHDTQPMSLRDILVHSSNIGTLLMTERIGEPKLAAYLDAFGFGHPTALGFPSESAGMVRPADQWQGADGASVSYGYGYATTALQLIAAVNAVANGGTYVAPRLLDATIAADGKVQPAPVSATHAVISPTAASTMVSMMTGVVCEGTGKDARIPGISVAGKTGTAYKTFGAGYVGASGERAYRATFVGFLPAADPKVTILVTIDEPDPTSNDRFGGKAAAPLFATVATSALHELEITPPVGDTGCAA